MNKQDMLNKEQVTAEEFIIQQLLIVESKTSLEATRRTFARLDKVIYKTNAKAVPLDKLLLCIEKAIKLQNGETIEDTTKPAK